MRQQPEVQPQLAAKCINEKLRFLVHFYMLYWSKRLPLWSKQQYASNCSIFTAHLLKMAISPKLWIQSGWNSGFSIFGVYTSHQISWCCSNQKCCSNLLQNCVNVKFRIVVHFLMLRWSGRLPLWSKLQHAANCRIFAAHLLQKASSQDYESSQIETQDWVS